MPTLIIISAAIIIGLLIFLYLILPSCRRQKDLDLLNGILIAHRGLHDLSENTPENSLAAFREAVLLNYPIEIDIHLTADNEVVVFHDDTLKRMCGIDKTIEEMTLEELKRLRILNTNEAIPTLRECLDCVNGKVAILIEFKCTSKTCKPLCYAANEILLKYSGLYFVQSFYPPVLLWYRKNRPEICRGQLSSTFKGQAIHKQMLGCLLFNFLSRPDFVSYDHNYANHPIRRLVSKLGALPVGWTFKNQNDINLDRLEFKTFIFEDFIPDKL